MASLMCKGRMPAVRVFSQKRRDSNKRTDNPLRIPGPAGPARRHVAPSSLGGKSTSRPVHVGQLTTHRSALEGSRSSRIARNAYARKRTVTAASLVGDVLQALPAKEVFLSASPGLAPALLVNLAVFVLGHPVLMSGLTLAGMAHAFVLGTIVFAAFGLKGFAMVCLYFVVGSGVTKLKLKQKQAEGIAEARSGRRGPMSVWGSGLAGAVCAAGAVALGPGASAHGLLLTGFIASFASKLGDTTSSEVGKAYGQTTYLSTTFERVPRGTEGAVSLEGTLAGLAAAALFAGAAAASGQISVQAAGVAALASLLANTFESWLGATVQDSVAWLTNDIINIIQISVAAALAVGMQWALGC